MGMWNKSTKKAKSDLDNFQEHSDRDRRSAGFDLSNLVDALRTQHAADAIDVWPWYILNPNGGHMASWDILTSVALIFTAIVTPFEVGFMPAPETAREPLFIINRIVDVIFSLDMCFQFFLAYRVTSEFAVAEPLPIVS